MEVLQCDGCDFRADSYDDLKTHIQEVHTVFLQPADADESDSLKDEDEDEEEEEEYEDKDDKDYTPPKAGTSMSTTLIQMLLLIYWGLGLFLFQITLYSRMITYFIEDHKNVCEWCVVAKFINRNRIKTK